jgi:hypothetical protein
VGLRTSKRISLPAVEPDVAMIGITEMDSRGPTSRTVAGPFLEAFGE